MADFDTEQLRQIFVSLSEKLANTKGDENIVEKLKAVEAAIRRLDKRESSAEKSSKSDIKKQNDELVKNLIKEMDNLSVFKQIADNTEAASENSGKISVDGLLDFNNSSKTAGKSAMALGGAFLKGATSFINGAANITNKMGNLTGSFTNLIDTMGISQSSLIGVTAKILDENVAAYRGIIESGEGTIGSLLDLRKAMSNTSLTASEFSKAMTDGAAGTRLVGGENWGSLYKGIKDQTKALGHYGYTTEGLINAQNDYLEILQGTGGIFSSSQQDMVDGLDNLLKSSENTASILGLTRKEAIELAKAQSRDSNVQTYLQGLGLTPDGAAAANRTMEMADAINKDFGAVMKDMFMMNGGVSQDTARTASLLPPEMVESMRNLAEDLRSGKIDENERIKRMEQIRDQFQAGTNDSDRASKAQLAHISGQQQFSAFSAMNIAFQNMKDIESLGVRGSEQNNDGTIAALQSEQVIKDAAAAAQDVITKSLFEPLDAHGKKVLETITTFDGLIKGTREVIAGTSSLTMALGVLTGAVLSGAFTAGAMKLATGLLSSVVGPLASGLGAIITSPLKFIGTGLSSLMSGLLGGNFISMITGAIGSVFASLPGILTGALSGAFAVGIGLIAGEASRIVDEGVSQYLYDNTSEETKDKWYGVREATEGFWDFFAQSPLSGVIQSGPNAGKNYWSGEQEYKQVNGEWVELTEDEKSGKTKIIEDERDKYGGYKTYEPKTAEAPREEIVSGVNKPDEIKAIVEEQKNNVVSEVKPETSLGKIETAEILAEAKQNTDFNKMLEILPEKDREMFRGLEDMFEYNNEIKHPQHSGIMGMETSSIPVVDSTTIDQPSSSSDTIALRIDNVISQLDKMNLSLRQLLDYDRDNGQIIRDRLTDLNRVNDDLLRMSKR